jgi:hypothetical protein
LRGPCGFVSASKGGRPRRGASRTERWNEKDAGRKLSESALGDRFSEEHDGLGLLTAGGRNG